jgi:RNA polymerase sigma-70 factor (ECF subfamily)
MIVDFRSLYERYAQDVYRFALYLCGDPLFAEDIAEETFVRAWVTPDEVRVGTVKAYLFMIARNLYRDGLKQAARQVELQDNLPDSKPSPEAVSSIRSELHLVLQALQTLPEVDRAVLLMHVQDDMPYAEIAAALGLSVAAVKVKVHRSRIELHRLRDQEREQL